MSIPNDIRIPSLFSSLTALYVQRQLLINILKNLKRPLEHGVDWY